ncbi:MAG: methyltransferase, partial [Deltaproteobacteria bacterium]|nr:methyltransferase [Deltaproteobacteria bacterium]
MRTTVDPILRGRLQIEQPEQGYRFNIDAILLAAFARRLAPPDVSRVVDLGAGCGVVGLLLGLELDGTKVVLVESQGELAALCRRNLVRNGMGDRGEARCEDLRLRRWASSSGSSLVVCNPPFFPLGRGRLNVDPMIAHARHELVGSLAQLLAATASGLNDGDVFVLIHDAQRGDEVVGTLRSLGLHLCARRLVLPLPGRS